MMPADRRHTARFTQTPPDALVYDTALSYGNRWLYVIMMRRADKDGRCTASYGDLANDLGVTKPAIPPLLKPLIENGHIKPFGHKEGGRHVRTIYSLVSHLKPVQEYRKTVHENPVYRKTVRLPLEVPPVLSYEDSGVSSSSSPVPSSPVPENIPTPSGPGKTPGGVGGKARRKAATPPKATTISRQQRPATPNRSARFIDAMTALGLRLGQHYDMDARDHSIIKGSSAEPGLIAEAYAGLRAHSWGTEFDWGNLSVRYVLSKINVYREGRDGRQDDSASRVAPRGNHVRGGYGATHGGGEAAAKPGKYDHLVYEF